MTYDPTNREQESKDRRRMRIAQRKREARSAMAVKTYVLDDVLPGLPPIPDTDDVCKALGIKARTTLHNVLYRHRDEMIAGGWDAAAGTFTREAVVRLCLLLRATTSRKAAEVAEAVGARDRVIKFNASKVPHIRRCQALIDKAFGLAERVRDEDPAEVWHDLNQMDAYTLQGITVALAAMVDLDSATGGVTQWLSSLAPSKRHPGKGNGGAASGLARLVPTPDEAQGIPLGKIPSLIDPELDEVAS
ncbi:hypothetical protein TM4_48 [Mycobacterium phage TM4]|uniref:Uncharacterized protein n=1 Tax=Mycobacterium phage TM4 TaxID=88870 RepID=Q9ZX30_BPMT4|nr:hypothetical protein TM4_gp48 [Mycobacterium phage TM4]AAD17615.1 hypothetical protein TM4_48 [Mycobacterium phage TM4]